LFAGQGLSEKIHTKSNAEGIESIVRSAKELDRGLVMANLVDFDMLFGHRNDVEGFVEALEYFDSHLPCIIETLSDGDLLLITADHGNDPTTPSTDHSREYVPILCCSKSGKRGVDLGVRNSFADVGKTVADYFGLEVPIAGESFLKMIL
jgi:phosphopentomutase